MTDLSSVAASADRAGLFALVATLAAAGVLPRDRAGHVLDAMLDVVLTAGLSPDDRHALISQLRADWQRAGGG
jgi:hypothetical protein